MSDTPCVKTVLILAANPTDTSRLRLDQEVREIEEGLKRAPKGGNFRVVQKWAVRSRLRLNLCNERPYQVEGINRVLAAWKEYRSVSRSRVSLTDLYLSHFH